MCRSLQFCLSRDLSRLIEFAAANRSGNAPSFTSGWECWALGYHPSHVFFLLVVSTKEGSKEERYVKIVCHSS